MSATIFKTVYKYAIPLRAGDDVWVPRGRVVNFGIDPFGVLSVWVEVTVDAAKNIFGEEEKQLFRVFATGQPIPLGADWRASAVTAAYVWHLYEVPV